MAAHILIEFRGESFTLQIPEKPIVIGRSRICDLSLTEPEMSKKHCSLFLLYGRVTIKDLETTNGTFLNHSQIKETQLYIGDVVTINQVKLTLTNYGMTQEEIDIHSRDFSNTKITFVNMQRPQKEQSDHNQEERTVVARTSIKDNIRSVGTDHKRKIIRDTKQQVSSKKKKPDPDYNFEFESEEDDDRTVVEKITSFFYKKK